MVKIDVDKVLKNPEFLRACEILDDIRPDGIIAGGFIRDLLLDRSYKDVDVFLSIHSSVNMPVSFQYVYPDDEKYIHNDVWAVAEHKLFGFTFNFIVLKTEHNVLDVLDRIDFGLCKVGWSNKEGLMISSAFYDDVEQEQITNYRTGWGAEGVNKHYERIKGKYPWPLVHKPTADMEVIEDWLVDLGDMVEDNG